MYFTPEIPLISHPLEGRTTSADAEVDLSRPDEAREDRGHPGGCVATR
jgi:hypothetical protein